jgi:hypothetical protein
LRICLPRPVGRPDKISQRRPQPRTVPRTAVEEARLVEGHARASKPLCGLAAIAVRSGSVVLCGSRLRNPVALGGELPSSLLGGDGCGRGGGV